MRIVQCSNKRGGYTDTDAARFYIPVGLSLGVHVVHPACGLVQESARGHCTSLSVPLSQARARGRIMRAEPHARQQEKATGT